MSRKIPYHIAIIMDGNGRWAQQHNSSRLKGHQAGVSSVREVIDVCLEQGVKMLTLFAFSSENWRRPPTEIDALMCLFKKVLEEEVNNLNEQGIQLLFIGKRARFSHQLQNLMYQAEVKTQHNQALQLIVAFDYGGRWDIVEAARSAAAQVEAGALAIEDINEELFANMLSTRKLRDPDLFIRTGGEERISNFFLWQLAYTELYFSEKFWPEFGREALLVALEHYSSRQRRFGYTSEQVEQKCLLKE